MLYTPNVCILLYVYLIVYLIGLRSIWMICTVHLLVYLQGH
jgi:hypothetical protein